MITISEIKKPFIRLAQIGIVVRNVDESVIRYREVLGLEPDRIIEKSPTAVGTKYYYGKETDFFQKVALYQLKDVELELLQPLGGKSVLQDFLDEHGEGIHHIAFDTENFVETLNQLGKNGVKLIQTGPNSRHPMLHWGFFDTNEKLGTTLEIFNSAEVAKIEAEEAK